MSTFRLFSWGANSHGQLGHGNINEEELLIPKEVDLSLANLSPENIVKITGGAGHTLILDKTGQVYTCGWNDKGQAGTKESSSRFTKIEAFEGHKIIDIACGWDSSMALTENAQVFAWGSNSHGQLGLKTIAIGGKTNVPLKVELNEPVQRIGMGLRHSALVTQNGKIFVSGNSTKGQLGIDLKTLRCSDRFMEVPDLNHISDVSCGQHHTVGITKNNEIFVWGDNKHGQLGIDPALQKGSSKPMKIDFCKNMNNLYEVHSGWTHSGVLTSDKKVFLWGRNTYGQLGRSKTSKTEFWKPEVPLTTMKIQQLSVGSEHNVILTDDGAVLSWGWNEHGNCGNGKTENIFEPTKVSLPEGLGVLVGTGAGHSFAIIKSNC